MTKLRKLALAWIVAGAAIAIVASTTAYLSLRKAGYTDSSYIEANLRQVAQERNFDLEGAQRAGHSDKAIAQFLAEGDIAIFKESLGRALIAIGGSYLAFVLSVVAGALYRETRQNDVA